MANFGGFNYTTFRGVNLRETAAVRFAADGGFESTLSIAQSLDAARAWRFPDKSGSFPIMGTFQVDLQAITSTSNTYSTVVTVSGIRAEDAFVCFLNRGITAGYDPIGITSGSTARILLAAKPANGSVTMEFQGGQTTAATSLVYSYLAMR